jgi:NADH-quinone oxidoreductase subunit L
MALALIALAVGSVAAGYVGVPHALGGSNRIEQFLAPSFTVGSAAHAEGADEHAAAAGESLELGLMAISGLVAIGGIAIAAVFFLVNRRVADSVAASLGGAHRLLSNKYYVDEIYDATIVQPIRIVSEEGLWKRVDVRAIDRAVNGVGDLVRGLAGAVRLVQTGSVRAYAASLFLGVVLILGFYLWP